MKKLIAMLFLSLFAAVTVHADCMVFDATNPITLPGGTVVYRQSPLFPTALQVTSCASAAGALTNPANFIGIEVSPTCHAVNQNWWSRLSQFLRGPRILYTDGTICGPLLVTGYSIGQWTAY